MICVVTMIVHTPWHAKVQLSPFKKYVEHTCNFSNAGMISSMLYNGILMISCSLLAFKVRHLPDNFNESRFITMCICISVVIVVCFVPAFTILPSKLVKYAMLALATGLNHSVALVFLFLPKIYSVFHHVGNRKLTSRHRD